MTYAHSEYLTSPQELMQQLNDPSLRIYDTSVLLLAAASTVCTLLLEP